MADALRRVLLLAPLLVLSALGLFWLFGTTGTVQNQLGRPLFYNPSPTSSERAASEALRLLENDPERARIRLAALGGAALPHLLPRLAELSPSERRLLADALWPVAVRMGLGQEVRGPDPAPGGGESATSATAPGEGRVDFDAETDRRLLFWERYRENHGIDYRPLSVQRLVRRLGSRSQNLRLADLVVVDTFALPALVNELGRVESQSDVERIRRLVPHIERLTGRRFSRAGSDDPETARAVASDVRAYWDEHGAVFTDHEPLSLVAAHVTQTEFATWVRRTAREATRLDTPQLFRRISSTAKPTGLLVLGAMIGALVLGPILAGLLELLQFERSRARPARPETTTSKTGARWAALSARTSGGRVALGGRMALALGLSCLLPIGASMISSGEFGRSLFSALGGATVSAFVLHRELVDRIDWRSRFVLHERAPLARIHAVGSWLLPTLPTQSPLLLGDLALVVMSVELLSGAEGLGTALVDALRAGDLPFLMATCLGAGIVTGAVQVLSDLAIGAASPLGGD